MPPPPPPPADVAVADIIVTVSPNGSGGYYFAYSGPYSDAAGNLDFRKEKRAVKIDYALSTTIPGLRFKSSGEDAMWIAEKASLGDATSPRGPYRGDQFKSFATQANGTRMHVIDKNDDGKVYRYALRFDLNGQTVQDDPDVQNGGGH
jgi:hypothetical protein